MAKIMVDEMVDHGKVIGRSGPMWCHLTTEGDDSNALEELHRFAQKIGLRREWCSDHTQPKVRLIHYDIGTWNMRRKALAAGASFVPAMEQAYKRMGIER